MTDETHAELPIYHVCFAVSDLLAAMAELRALIGVTWGPPADEQFGDWAYRIVFSQAQPHLELIQGAPGSPWHTASARFHHLGVWTQDLSNCLSGWAAAGASIDFDGRTAGRHFAYAFAPNSGATLEAVDTVGRQSFSERWSRPGST